jgi:hypothetical protein
VTIYAEQGVVKLSTTASSVRVLKGVAVQRAMMQLIVAAEDAVARRA